MISDTLGFWTAGPVVLLFMAVPAALVILVVIYVTRGNKEREKLHQKMGELTDELKRTQEQLQKQKKSESSSKS